VQNPLFNCVFSLKIWKKPISWDAKWTLLVAFGHFFTLKDTGTLLSQKRQLFEKKGHFFGHFPKSKPNSFIFFFF
jgi:hypothetical protein